MNFFRVPVNIRETDAAYALEVVAPGLKKEDFQVNMTREMLTVSFERQEENKEEDERQGYVRNEFRMQSFQRSFHLDDSVDANNVNARYADGILQIAVPKKEEARPSTKKLRFSKCFTARHGRQTAAFFIPRRLQER